MKIKLDKKLITNILYMLIVIIIICAVITAITTYKSFKTDVNREIEYISYTIQNGDTLFDIASNLNRNEDIRKTVYEIRQDNDLDVGNLQIGQKIRIRR